MQIIKAVLLILGAALMTFWVFSKYGFSLSGPDGRCGRNSLLGDKLLAREKYGVNTPSNVGRLHLVDGPGLGTAGPPHVLMRFTTDFRRQGGPQVRGLGDPPWWWSVHCSAWCWASVPRCPGRRRRDQGRPVDQLRGPAAGLRTRRNVAAGFISAVAFATILAVVAGLTVRPAPFAHDVLGRAYQAWPVPGRRRGRSADRGG